jgi:WD40 repeat protein
VPRFFLSGAGLGSKVPSFRLLISGPGPAGHAGEVFCCAFTPDGNYVLSGGWDGYLRLWENSSGIQAAAFPVSQKPISACGASPDGKSLYSGCLEGFLTRWDTATQKPTGRILAHSRPLSAITYAPDGSLLATASWDQTVILWKLNRERQGLPLVGHADIVAGCRFTPGGQALLSWSYDGTLGVWDVSSGQRQTQLSGHTDRVTAGAVSPDGSKAASGSRDHTVKLWDLRSFRQVASVAVAAEVKACCFMLDGQSLVAVDAQGRLTLHALPELEMQAELATRLSVECADLSPCSDRIALGCENGQVRLVAVEGFESAPLFVTATRTSRRTATPLQRLFGKHRLIHAYQCTCPVCRQAIELPDGESAQPLPCPGCRRPLRIAT